MSRSVRDFTTVALLILVAPAAAGQITGGALIGRVSDEKNAAVAAAEVTAFNAATGLSRTLKTRADGRYRFPSLPTGSYEVTAEHAGFATIVVRRIDVLLGVARHVDVRLHHVSEEEELTITAPVRVVESGPAIGIIVRRDLIDNVPLRRRSANELATLAPLADPTRARPLAQTIIDGAISSTDLPLDAVAELHATTREYPAEYGRTSGGVLLVTTRKGTNDVAGDAFAFYRRDDHLWQWGAAVGGPIVKDTSHAFAAFDRQRDPRAFVAANVDLSSRHFVEGEYAHGRDSVTLRDLWLAHESLWNEFIVNRAAGANQIRETIDGAFTGSAIRHDWTVGAVLQQNGTNGYFVQDAIVARKLVLNAGVRLDDGVSPRVGWTYDVNGSGRNLLRGSFGRYRNPDSDDASLGYSWQLNPWVALNFDTLHSMARGERGRDALAVSGQVMFSSFVSLAGSYAYSDHLVTDDDARHTAAIAGTLHLPGGFWMSGIGRYRSAGRLSDRLAGTDLRVAKRFESKRGVAVDAMADVFNVFDQSRRAPGNERTEQVGLRVSF